MIISKTAYTIKCKTKVLIFRLFIPATPPTLRKRAHKKPLKLRMFRLLFFSEVALSHAGPLTGHVTTT